MGTAEISKGIAVVAQLGVDDSHQEVRIHSQVIAQVHHERLEKILRATSGF
jgi:hypothetical protein